MTERQNLSRLSVAQLIQPWYLLPASIVRLNKKLGWYMKCTHVINHAEGGDDNDHD